MANPFLFCAALTLWCSLTAAQQWTSNPQPPFSLGEVASAIIGNSLILVGQGASSTCKFAIKPLGSSWNCNLAKRQYAGDHHAVVNPGDGTMWLVGGFGSDGRVRGFFLNYLVNMFRNPLSPLLSHFSAEPRRVVDIVSKFLLVHLVYAKIMDKIICLFLISIYLIISQG